VGILIIISTALVVKLSHLKVRNCKRNVWNLCCTKIYIGSSGYITLQARAALHEASERPDFNPCNSRGRQTAMKRVTVRTASLLIVFVVATASFAAAQSASFGSITGQVTDPQRAVVGNATVTAKNLNTGLERSATTKWYLHHSESSPRPLRRTR
jgi:hypothetical protein